jgi:hypothetical protein
MVEQMYTAVDNTMPNSPNGMGSEISANASHDALNAGIECYAINRLCFAVKRISQSDRQARARGSDPFELPVEQTPRRRIA